MAWKMPFVSHIRFTILLVYQIYALEDHLTLDVNRRVGAELRSGRHRLAQCRADRSVATKVQALMSPCQTG